jgi:hypothetical protein
MVNNLSALSRARQALIRVDGGPSLSLRRADLATGRPRSRGCFFDEIDQARGRISGLLENSGRNC